MGRWTRGSSIMSPPQNGELQSMDDVEDTSFRGVKTNRSWAGRLTHLSSSAVPLLLVD